MATSFQPQRQEETEEEEEKDDFSFNIIPSEDGFCFDLEIKGKNTKNLKKIRDKLRAIGGEWIKARSVYLFMASDMKKVSEIIGDNSIVPMMDPSKTLRVNFGYQFQCNDVSSAEDILQKIGLKKDRSGVWQGNIGHIDIFMQAFTK